MYDEYKPVKAYAYYTLKLYSFVGIDLIGTGN